MAQQPAMQTFSSHGSYWWYQQPTTEGWIEVDDRLWGGGHGQNRTITKYLVARFAGIAGGHGNVLRHLHRTLIIACTQLVAVPGTANAGPCTRGDGGLLGALHHYVGGVERDVDCQTVTTSSDKDITQITTKNMPGVITGACNIASCCEGQEDKGEYLVWHLD